MKKSEIYRRVQYLVLAEADIGTYARANEFLEILRELMAQEDLAKFAEEQEAKKDETV